MLSNYVIIIIATAPKISYFSPAECSYRSNIHMYNRENMQLIFFKSDSVKNNQRSINKLTYKPNKAPVIAIFIHKLSGKYGNKILRIAISTHF